MAATRNLPLLEQVLIFHAWQAPPKIAEHKVELTVDELFFQIAKAGAQKLKT